ncbi:hypothetical protein BKA70DRAFT_1211630 [Coprinopsis sp. MPI-PUGE-AT-0042]|nr:hypothetical protein BKA70DRAFT_1211630 [Coprinopsis sp. MPI-PUGE-AT-0042]
MGNTISWLALGSDDPSQNDEIEQMPGGWDLNQTVSVIANSPGAIVNGGTFYSVGRDNINLSIHVHPPLSTDKVTILIEVRDWLSAVNFRKIQAENFSKGAPGTGMWFIMSPAFQRLLKSKYGILWGTGMPGAGKTILASLVISYLDNRAASSEAPGISDCSIAYVYCRYTEPLSVEDILAALVRQLLERYNFLLEVVEPMFAKHKFLDTRPSISELLSVLRDFTRRFKSNFYVLDGLDEALSHSRFDLLQALTSIRGHFVIFSRPLDLLKSSVPEATFVNIAAHGNDIELYVKQQIAKTPLLQDIIASRNLEPEVVHKIVHKAHGMFLHAFLQVELLKQCVSVKQLMGTLEQMPTEIGSMYVGSLNRIEHQPAEHIKIARLALMWLAYAMQPLTIEDLRHAIARSHGSSQLEEDELVPQAVIVSVCCGLVVCEAAGQVRLVHYTAKDALAPMLQKYHPNPHAMIANTCIELLISRDLPRSNFQPGDIFSLDPSDGYNPDTFDFVSGLEELPLLRYAYDNWHLHAHESILVPSVTDSLLQFFRQCRSFPTRAWEDNDSLSRLHERSLVYLDREGFGFVDDPTAAVVFAALYSHTGVLHRLLDLPETDVNICEGGLHGRTLLMLEASLGRKASVVELLRSPRIDVNRRDVHGHTALILSLKMGQPHIAHLLLEVVGINVVATDAGWATALTYASAGGYTDIVSRLLEFPGIDPNSATKDGATPLIFALEKGHVEVALLLLAYPLTDINATRKDGWTALLFALYLNLSPVVDLLLENPKLVVQTQSGKWSPLMVACYKGRAETVKRILTLPGNDTNATLDVDGWDALMIASALGNAPTVQNVLQDASVTIFRQLRTKGNQIEVPALTLACWHGHIEVVSQLLSYIAGQPDMIEFVDLTGLVDLATDHGHEPVVACMLSFPFVKSEVEKYRRAALYLSQHWNIQAEHRDAQSRRDRAQTLSQGPSIEEAQDLCKE